MNGDHEAYASAVANKALLALSQSEIRSEAFSLGSVTFRVEGPASKSQRWIGRAFAAKAISSNEPVSHTLTFWEGWGDEIRPPPARWDSTKAQPLSGFSRDANETIRRVIDGDTGSLVVSNFTDANTYVWYPEIETLPHWALASPLRIPLSWLCNRHNMQIVHGAAVGIDGRAVLLAGNGGAGKSTTALACALAGFDYLGDDYCAVEPSAGKVHMVYRSAKVLSSTLDMLPALRPHIENLDLIEMEKGVAFLGADVKLCRSAEISAILLPRLDDGSTALRSATREEVMKAILPSTVVGLMGGTSLTPRFLMELVRSVPAYHLPLKRDLAAVVDAVGSCVR